MEGGRGLRVARNVKFAAVRDNEGILSHNSLCGKAEVKLPEDMPESFREEFGPLLDESGSRGNLIRQEIWQVVPVMVTGEVNFHLKIITAEEKNTISFIKSHNSSHTII